MSRGHLPDHSYIVKVGAGRGFGMKWVVKIPSSRWKLGNRRPQSVTDRRVAVTCAHCLPHLPPAEERRLGPHDYLNYQGDIQQSDVD
jgi:hypothetical protein